MSNITRVELVLTDGPPDGDFDRFSVVLHERTGATFLMAFGPVRRTDVSHARTMAGCYVEIHHLNNFDETDQRTKETATP